MDKVVRMFCTSEFEQILASFDVIFDASYVTEFFAFFINQMTMIRFSHFGVW